MPAILACRLEHRQVVPVAVPAILACQLEHRLVAPVAVPAILACRLEHPARLLDQSAASFLQRLPVQALAAAVLDRVLAAILACRLEHPARLLDQSAASFLPRLPVQALAAAVLARVLAVIQACRAGHPVRLLGRLAASFLQRLPVQALAAAVLDRVLAVIPACRAGHPVRLLGRLAALFLRRLPVRALAAARPGMPLGSGPGSYPGMPPGAGPGSYPGMPTGAGMMPPGLSPPGPGMGSGSAGGAPGAVNPMSLMVGVSMLGEGSTKELLEKAADQGIDVLVVFEIEVNENQKTNLVVNETRIVVYDVAKGEDLEKSKPLNNIAIQKLRAEDEKKDEEDPVTACFAKLFKMLDDDPEKGLKMREIPAEIKPEHVESRVAAILAKEDIAPAGFGGNQVLPPSRPRKRRLADEELPKGTRRGRGSETGHGYGSGTFGGHWHAAAERQIDRINSPAQVADCCRPQFGQSGGAGRRGSSGDEVGSRGCRDRRARRPRRRC